MTTPGVTTPTAVNPNPSTDIKTNKRPWSIEENEALRQAISQVGTSHWNDVAALVPGRQGIQCMQHWQQVLDPALVKGLWTHEEDSRLREIKVNNPNLNWTEVASQIAGRSSKQCRERWTTNVDPSIKKTPFTAEEDAIIMTQWKLHGAKWSIICEMLPGRAQTKVRDRFKQLMRKRENNPGGVTQRVQRNSRGSSKAGSSKAASSKVGRASAANSQADNMTSSALAALLSLRSTGHSALKGGAMAGTTQAGSTSSVLSFASRFNTKTASPKKQFIQRANAESPNKRQRLVEHTPSTETKTQTANGAAK